MFEWVHRGAGILAWQEDEAELAVLSSAQRALNQRRVCHPDLMHILDGREVRFSCKIVE